MNHSPRAPSIQRMLVLMSVTTLKTAEIATVPNMTVV